MFRWDTGGGMLGIVTLGILGSIGVYYAFAYVVEPIVCAVSAGCGSASW